jgi:hypothetical protein
MEIKLGGKYNNFLSKRKIEFLPKVNKFKKDKMVIIILSFLSLQLTQGRKHLSRL